MYQKQIYKPVALAMLLGLAGCGGEPSSSDVEKVLKTLLEAKSAQLQKLSMVSIHVHSIKKIGCVSDKESTGYNCDVEVDASNSMTGRNKGITKMRFVKGSDGWHVVK